MQVAVPGVKLVTASFSEGRIHEMPVNLEYSKAVEVFSYARIDYY